MEISEDRRGDVLALAVAGRLDTTTSKTLEERILAVIDGGTRRLVVDLARLVYVSSAGLRVLLLAARRLAAVNGTMALCSLTEPVKEVFDIAGFSSIFTICASRDEAVSRV